MELRNTVRNIQTNTEGNAAFTIKTSAKAFKILSDNLYADKILAVVRELSTNAYDSHVQAGKKNVPFEVHLPSHNEPWFSVKDFGTGMSHEDVMTLYTSYFDSDKTDSNEVVGALGLGSKSPFAYTDSFTVDVNYSGVHRSYACFIDKTGTPNITLMNEEETQSGNGVEVKMAVRNHDIDSFAQKARRIYRAFETKPFVLGRPNFEHYNDKPRYSGKSWMLSEQDSWNDRNCFAVQGNIAYPLDEARLGILDEQQEFVINNKFFIKFQLGQLDIAASREDLSYDKITIENIHAALTQVYNEFVEQINERMNEHATLWNARIDAFQFLKSVRYNDNLKLHYHGTALNENAIRFMTEDLNGLQVYKYENGWNGTRRDHLTKYRGWSVNPVDNVSFVYDDLGGRKPISRAKYYAETAGKAALLFVGEKKDFQKVIDKLGHPEVLKASELEDKPRSAAPRYNTGEKVKAYKPIVGAQISTYKQDHLTRDDLPKGKKFYVPSHRKDILDGEQHYEASYATTMMEHLKALGILNKDYPVYAVPAWELKNKKFGTVKNMFNLFDYYKKRAIPAAKKAVDEIISWKQDKARLEKMNVSNNIRTIMGDQKVMNKIGENSPIKEFIRKYNKLNEKVQENSNRVQSLINIARKFKIEYTVPEIENVEGLTASYPMIDMMDRWEFRHDADGKKAEAIADYINMIDSKEVR